MVTELKKNKNRLWSNERAPLIRGTNDPSAHNTPIRGGWPVSPRPTSEHSHCGRLPAWPDPTPQESAQLEANGSCLLTGLRKRPSTRGDVAPRAHLATSGGSFDRHAWVSAGGWALQGAARRRVTTPERTGRVPTPSAPPSPK